MTMRITGLASGMDTEKMIQDMMKAERMRVNTVHRNRTWVQWQQEAYRDIIRDVRGFQSSYFDTLKPTQNFRSPRSFSKFSYDVKTAGGASTNAVDVTASASSQNRNVTINSIDELATADRLTGNASDIRGIFTDGTTDPTSALKFNLSIGNNTKVIDIAADGGRNLEGLKDALNTEIVNQFGSAYSGMVTNDGSKLRFDMAGQNLRITSYADDTNDTMDALGIESGVTSEMFRSKSIRELFGAQAGAFDFEIGGKSVELNGEMTLNEMMNTINRSDLGVRMSYSLVGDRITLESTQEGSANNMTIAGETKDLLVGMMGNLTEGQFNGTEGNPRNRVLGQDASLTIDGVEIIQSQNTFTLDGITYNLRAKSTEAIHVNVDVNVDEMVDQIKGFIDEYNKILDTLSSPRSERRYYDFQPLTDEERRELSEEEVEKWDAKAKSGLLRNASELETMTRRMRNAMIEPIDGVGVTMASIGISSSNFRDQGRLTVDEDKLRKALENDFDEVVKLFSQSSEHSYGDSTNASERYQNSGIAHRLDDIFRDYTRTTRGQSGNKGILVERAGIEMDTSFTQNLLSRQLQQFDQRIDRLEDFLAQRENYYYTMFAKMEAALAEMHAQSASLGGMFGM